MKGEKIKDRNSRGRQEGEPGHRRRRLRAMRPREWEERFLRHGRLKQCRPSVFCSPIGSGSPLLFGSTRRVGSGDISMKGKRFDSDERRIRVTSANRECDEDGG